MRKMILLLGVGLVLLGLGACDLTDPLTLVGQYEKSQCALYQMDPHAFGGQKPGYCP